jgi:hypothetical protein
MRNRTLTLRIKRKLYSSHNSSGRRVEVLSLGRDKFGASFPMSPSLEVFPSAAGITRALIDHASVRMRWLINPLLKGATEQGCAPCIVITVSPPGFI